MSKRTTSERRRFREKGARTPLALKAGAESELYEATETPETATDKTVAIVSILGPLEHHASWFFDSYEDIIERVQGAMECEEVQGVILRIDSPGGDAGGMVETHKALRALSAAHGKPLFAFADECAASAGYGLACAADDLWLTESAHVGSVGVIAEVWDETAALEKAGVRVELVTTGARKGDGHPAKPITNDVREALQAQVDAVAAPFFAAVARARRMSTKAVVALEAGVFTGQAAVDAGLADGVCSWGEFLVYVGQAIEALLIDNDPSSSGGVQSGKASGRPVREKTEMSMIMLLQARDTARAALASAKTDEDRIKATLALEAAVEAVTKYKKTHEKETEEEVTDEDGEDEDSKKSEEDAEDEDSKKAEEDDGEDDEPESTGSTSADDEAEEKKMLGSRTGLYTASRLLRLCRQVTGEKKLEAIFGALDGIGRRVKHAAKLEGRIKSLEERNRKQAVSSMLSAAMREGRITKAEAESLRSQSPTWIKAHLAVTPKRVRTTEEGAARTPEFNPTDPLAGLSPEQRKMVEQTAASLGKPVAEVAATVAAAAKANTPKVERY